MMDGMLPITFTQEHFRTGGIPYTLVPHNLFTQLDLPYTYTNRFMNLNSYCTYWDSFDLTLPLLPNTYNIHVVPPY